MNKTKSPLFSIITVSFNSEDTISDTLDSILQQEFKDFELIVVDGASDDRTSIILDSYREDFKAKNINLNIISEKDSGIYNAMNKGIDISTGLYCIFMNSDDIFHSPNVLTSVATRHKDNILKDKYVDITYGGIEFVLSKFNKKYHKIVHADDICVDKLIKYMCLSHQSCFYRTSFLKIEKYNENYKIGADYDHLIRAYKSGKIFDKVDSVIAIKRISEKDISSDPIKLTLEFIKIQLQYNSFFSRTLFFHYNRLVIYILRRVKEKSYSSASIEKESILRMIKSGYRIKE